jgi:hypothetical protein
MGLYGERVGALSIAWKPCFSLLNQKCIGLLWMIGLHGFCCSPMFESNLICFETLFAQWNFLRFANLVTRSQSLTQDDTLQCPTSIDQGWFGSSRLDDNMMNQVSAGWSCLQGFLSVAHNCKDHWFRLQDFFFWISAGKAQESCW